KLLRLETRKHSSTTATWAQRTIHHEICLRTCQYIHATPRPWATWSPNSSTSNCSTPSNTSSSCAAHHHHHHHPPHRPPPPCNNNCDTSSLCHVPRAPRTGPFSDCDAFPPAQPLLHPKLETHPNPSTPPTPPTSVDDVVVCAGCGMRISDRFYLLAVDRRWHASCLQCCQCRQTLDGETTCYAREGNIYCKKDYYRRFAFVV
ncbi:hypothetical protein L9F63_020476, partial [Diploptera punctata]